MLLAKLIHVLFEEFLGKIVYKTYKKTCPLFGVKTMIYGHLNILSLKYEKPYVTTSILFCSLEKKRIFEGKTNSWSLQLFYFFTHTALGIM